jgi:hypothetical protein
MSVIEIGRLLRGNTSQFVVGCRVTQLSSPSFGCLVRVPLEDGYQIYGLIHDIHIDDDGLVRQLVTAERADDEAFGAVIADNRLNRNIPIEMSVLAVGYRQQGASSTCCRRGRRSAWTAYTCANRKRSASSPSRRKARSGSAISGTSCAPATCQSASSWQPT